MDGNYGFLSKITGHSHPFAIRHLEVMEEATPFFAFADSFADPGTLRFHHVPSSNSEFEAIGTVTGWWLGHPSEKYESQLG